jgi:hypothetical protein
MRKLVLCGVALVLAACGPKKEPMPAADSTAMPAPAATDTTMKPDSMMTRDTAHKM